MGQSTENQQSNYAWQVQEPNQGESFSIDDLVQGRTRIVKTKLEVLASAIHTRLQIRSANLERIEDNQTKTSKMLIELDKRANYLTRQHREKSPFYTELFKLQSERRSQDVECWRDIVLILRDFLSAWEAHEQAKAKAMFLDHV